MLLNQRSWSLKVSSELIKVQVVNWHQIDKIGLRHFFFYIVDSENKFQIIASQINC